MEAKSERSVQWISFLFLKNEHGCSSDNGKQRNSGEQQDWNRRPIGVHAGSTSLNDVIISARGCPFSWSEVLSQSCFPSLFSRSAHRPVPVSSDCWSPLRFGVFNRLFCPIAIVLLRWRKCCSGVLPLVKPFLVRPFCWAFSQI